MENLFEVIKQIIKYIYTLTFDNAISKSILTIVLIIIIVIAIIAIYSRKKENIDRRDY